jgi:hypothetical protein
VPLPVILDTMRVVLNWTPLGDALPINVLHFADGAGDADDLEADLRANLEADMWKLVSNVINIDHVDITPLDGLGSTRTYDWSGVSTAVGQQSGNPIPNSCGLVKFGTVLRGRSYRGRCYLPALAENVTELATLDPTAVQDTTDAWRAWRLAVASANGWKLSVASYTLGVHNDVINIRCERMAATQRRRQARNSL